MARYGFRHPASVPGRPGRDAVTRPFCFQNAAVAVPGDAIDAHIAAHGLPTGFDDWKARSLLALASLAAPAGAPLQLITVGAPNGPIAAWLEKFRASVPDSGDTPAPPAAPATLTLLGLPAAQADNAAAQSVFAACADGTGPDALFVTRANASHADDISHSFAGTFDALAASGYLRLQDGYFSAWLRPQAPELRQHARLEAQAMPPSLQARMLFVVGHARSGTSALFELLNYHPDLLLLFESNAFLPRMRRHFAENFSARMEATRPARRKGFFCAPPPAMADHPLTVFPALLDHYRMVGEKIAIAPRHVRFERSATPLCFDYYARLFPFSKYIFLARTPFEATEALHRILPAADLAEILRAYAEYMSHMLEFQNIFPASRVMFMEDFEHLNSAALNSLVGFDLLPDNVTLSSAQRTTRQALPAPCWEELNYELHSANDLYRRTREMFSPNGYQRRTDAKWPDFEALVAAWKAVAAEAAERAFAEA